jgi:hypothetical protein
MRRNIVTGFILGLLVGAVLMRMWMDRYSPPSNRKRQPVTRRNISKLDTGEFKGVG